MTEADVSRILATLALVGVAVVIALAISLIVPRTRRRWHDPRVVRLLVPAAALVALGATTASLYYSEGVGFIPCELCWYQRIAMYPLAIILLMASAIRARDVFWYALPLAILGLAVSVRHQIEQQWPGTGGSCTIGVPCSVRDVWEYGFVSIPFMAGTAFAFVIVTMAGLALAQRR